jgi:diguanylate cyclase (GGDEF)-like protein
MPLLGPVVVAGTSARLALALGGTASALLWHSWPAATACFAALSGVLLLWTNAALRRERAWRVAARCDPLTGVANYRRLHERLTASVAADPKRLAVLTLDVDQFKAINERYGHLEGDRLLQEVGQTLMESVRGSDVVARQGGDEFAVLASETDEAGARLLAERIEKALERIHVADHKHVRASVGIAVYPGDGRTPEDLLERADVELRRNKEQRREALTSTA